MLIAKKLNNLMVIFPLLFSFFYFFERDVSNNSLHVLCLAGLLLALFSNESVFKVKNSIVSWRIVFIFSFILIFVSFLFYYFLNDSGSSYLSSSYSIVLTIVPFAIFFRVLDRDELVIYLLIIVFIASAIVSHWLGQQDEYGVRVIESRYFKLLYFAPLVVVFKWMNIDLKMFFIVTSLGIVGALIATIVTYCCFELANGDLIDKFTFSESVSGNTNPIFFGLISLVLTMPIILFVLFKKCDARKIIIFSIISILGIINILASESRGVWLSFLIILFSLLFIFSLKVKITLVKKALIVLFSVFSILVAFNTQIVQDRVTLALSEIKAYQEIASVDDVKSTSSFGARVELWKASIKIFKNNYYFGVGPGGYKSELVKLSNNGEFKKEFAIFNQAHGQYFHVLATRGVFGALALMSLLVGLLVFFVKKSSCSSYQVKYLAGCGIVVMASYIFLGATESPFERRSTIVYFVFYVSLIVAAIKQFVISKKIYNYN